MALLGLVKINFNSSLVKSFSLAITGSLPSNSGIIPNLRIFSISNSDSLTILESNPTLYFFLPSRPSNAPAQITRCLMYRFVSILGMGVFFPLVVEHLQHYLR